jgi:DNA-binding CsgD family transcriptional regulator
MSIYRHLSAMHLQNSLGQMIIDGLPHPVVLVDASRGLRYANRAAHLALANRRYIVDRHGLLGCRRGQDDSKLTEALVALGLDAHDKSGDGRRIVRIHAIDNDEPIGVCLSPLRPPEVMGAFGSLALAMLMFYDSSQAAAMDPEFFGEIFDLTPAEARVALLLANGASLQEVAEQRRVSMNTVLSQVKALKTKTGTSKQSDLVRKLVSTPAFLSE